MLSALLSRLVNLRIYEEVLPYPIEVMGNPIADRERTAEQQANHVIHAAVEAALRETGVATIPPALHTGLATDVPNYEPSGVEVITTGVQASGNTYQVPVTNPNVATSLWCTYVLVCRYCHGHNTYGIHDRLILINNSECYPTCYFCGRDGIFDLRHSWYCPVHPAFEVVHDLSMVMTPEEQEEYELAHRQLEDAFNGDFVR